MMTDLPSKLGKRCQGILASCSTRFVEVAITPQDCVFVLGRKNVFRTITFKHFANIYVEKLDKHLRSVGPHFDF